MSWANPYQIYQNQLTEEERKAYDRYEENTHYEASMHESHYGRGKLEGVGLATHRIAKSMLKRGVEIDLIMEDTGLKREEIEKIRESI